MGVMKTMHADYGDERLAWDMNDPKQVMKAQDRFDGLLTGRQGGRKHNAFLMDPTGKKGKQIDAFDPSAGAILMVPQLVGG